MIMHHVIGTGWVHTHGMDELGLPELEVRDIPDFLAEDVARLLSHICKYMQTGGKPVQLGEVMETSPRTRFRFVKPEPMSGSEDHYLVERWQIVDAMAVCECCGLKSCEKTNRQ